MTDEALKGAKAMIDVLAKQEEPPTFKIRAIAGIALNVRRLIPEGLLNEAELKSFNQHCLEALMSITPVPRKE